MAAANVLGVFAHVDTTLQAIRDLRARGFGDLTVYTPVPIEEIEEEVESLRPLSSVRLFTLVGGLLGTATGFFLTICKSSRSDRRSSARCARMRPANLVLPTPCPV